MRRFIALVLFSSTIILCSVASAYSDQFPPDRREALTKLAVCPAVHPEPIEFKRPETPEERLQTYATVANGFKPAPQPHCNSPGHAPAT